jgi:Acetyltransferase (GNAT) domain
MGTQPGRGNRGKHPRAVAVVACYSVHERLVEAKGGYNFIFPREFLFSLIADGKMGRMFVARLNDSIIGGGLFLRDGDSIFYLHSAHDRQYSKLYPSCAVINAAIRWAHETGAASFNFGGSGGIDSLEKFKSFWGATLVENWHFSWQHPFWANTDKLRRWASCLANALGKRGRRF